MGDSHEFWYSFCVLSGLVFSLWCWFLSCLGLVIPNEYYRTYCFPTHISSVFWFNEDNLINFFLHKSCVTKTEWNIQLGYKLPTIKSKLHKKIGELKQAVGWCDLSYNIETILSYFFCVLFLWGFGVIGFNLGYLGVFCVFCFCFVCLCFFASFLISILF